ncbi:hypothetical protein OIU84_012871 [Salix udensis]|uniref:Uncharacterized protein n=1 Tax=Salix udensis TaxID=889485 RepID=A0AAD6NTR7_9ROSI|nr:hypothetical protein OIU84_012871 [Salix udensis]
MQFLRNGNPLRLFHKLIEFLSVSRTCLRNRLVGFLLPKSAVKFERYLMGEVLSVGAEAGEVEAGKRVLFSDINAYEIDLGTDAKHCFCKAGDLLAVVE